ncbi:hypothetical protein GCK32_015318, partial [Trichostrongylus colubriformis]
MFSEEDSYPTSVANPNAIGAHENTGNSDEKKPSLLEDEGDEINLMSDSRSKLRLDTSLDPGNGPETSGNVEVGFEPPLKSFFGAYYLIRQ